MKLYTTFRWLFDGGMNKCDKYQYSRLAKKLGGIRKYGRGTHILLSEIYKICGARIVISIFIWHEYFLPYLPKAMGRDLHDDVMYNQKQSRDAETVKVIERLIKADFTIE